MPKKADLMGLGLPFQLARRLATEPTLVVGGGTSAGSAVPLAGDQYLVCVTASTGSNSAVLLPQVGGDLGCLLGDDFNISNLCTGSVVVYIANNASGSAVSIIQGGNVTVGTTGISIGTNKAIVMQSITASTWHALTA